MKLSTGYGITIAAASVVAGGLVVGMSAGEKPAGPAETRTCAEKLASGFVGSTDPCASAHAIERGHRVPRGGDPDFVPRASQSTSDEVPGGDHDTPVTVAPGHTPRVGETWVQQPPAPLPAGVTPRPLTPKSRVLSG